MPSARKGGTSHCGRGGGTGSANAVASGGSRPEERDPQWGDDADHFIDSSSDSAAVVSARTLAPNRTLVRSLRCDV